MLGQGLIVKAKWAMMQRAGEVKGATKFKLKNKKSKTEGKVDMAKERSKVLANLERYGKALSYPKPKKPVRTEAELLEARDMVLMRNKKLQQREFEMRRRETTYLSLRALAFEELPSESLKQAATVPDATPFPRDFITVLQSPPLEEEEVFGPFMAYGTRRPDDEIRDY